MLRFLLEWYVLRKAVNNMKKIAILIGTRPELTKMAPVMRSLRSHNLPFIFIHSNQHYSQNMDGVFLKDLRLPKPDYNLEVGSGSHAVQTGKILAGVEKVLQKEQPRLLLVHGDTNTTLAGALAAKKLHIDVGHVEAGLRSHDYTMPEEINRILVDRISNLLFAPTKDAAKNLSKEGIKGDQVIVTGNTVVDAVKQHLEFTKECNVLSQLSLDEYKYILVTAHRAETVDEKDTLKKLVDLLDHVIQKMKQPMLIPLHPRTAQKLREYSLTLPEGVTTIEPVGYIEMLTLLRTAALVLTDSGGLQEEAYVLHRPLMTLRNSTERPETLSANFLIHLDKKGFDTAKKAYDLKQVSWKRPFGSGHAAEKIVTAIEKYL